jgi:hypothetical protein
MGGHNLVFILFCTFYCPDYIYGWKIGTKSSIYRLKTTSALHHQSRIYVNPRNGDELSYKAKIDPENLKREANNLRQEAEKLSSITDDTPSSRIISGLDFIVEKNFSSYVSPAAKKPVEQVDFMPTDDTKAPIVASRRPKIDQVSNMINNDNVKEPTISSTNITFEELLSNKTAEFSFERGGYRYVMVRDNELDIGNFKDEIPTVRSFLDSYKGEMAGMRKLFCRILMFTVLPSYRSLEDKNIQPFIDLAFAKVVSYSLSLLPGNVSS